MVFAKTPIIVILMALLVTAGCRTGDPSNSGGSVPSVLGEVPAVRLNFRYEADVPPPTNEGKPIAAEELNAAIQADFDQNRPQELLDKTITSPDKKRILAVYHRAADIQSEFRLDMYTGDGKILRKVTPDTMGVHFPDTIVWAPDSSAVAFVAMVRAGQEEGAGVPPPGPDTGAVPSTNANAAVNANTAEPGEPEVSPAANEAVEPAQPTPAPPASVLTFRTEQIYLCDVDGGDLEPVTQNEGLIYFYYVWSPDSTMLASLAATVREWQYLQYEAERAGQVFMPQGRPRLVEKNGRERRLDDALTAVRPVWSPDSTKVAAAFDVQIRIYDAVGNSPTQAAIPLRNHLLLSSQAFDRDQAGKLQAANTAPDANTPTNTNVNAAQASSTLPDPSTLVSFNPIVALEWNADEILYFQTAFVKKMKNEADSVTSFARWHRLVLTPQPSVLSK